ncbi:hypothetical protein [Sinorhizobium meliloti]|uniref:hypothetical protein n=1 Tax=Rhizobium meliloti TaxID=382 RepID=UPI0030D4880C
MARLVARFGVSGSYMARVCTGLGVPRPPRGYWAKRAAGQSPPVPPLPECGSVTLPGWSKGMPSGWLKGMPSGWSRGLMPNSGSLPEAFLSAVPGGRRPRPREVHPLVASGLPAFLSAGRVDMQGYIRPTKRLTVDVTVSRQELGRTMAFTNDLFTSLEHLGCPVRLAPAHALFVRREIDLREDEESDPFRYGRPWMPLRPTVAYIGTVPLGLAVIEMSEFARHLYVGEGRFVRDETAPGSEDESSICHMQVPSGRLKLAVYSPYHPVPWTAAWRETEALDLAGQMGEVIDALPGAAEELSPG